MWSYWPYVVMGALILAVLVALAFWRGRTLAVIAIAIALTGQPKQKRYDKFGENIWHRYTKAPETTYVPPNSDDSDIKDKPAVGKPAAAPIDMPPHRADADRALGYLERVIDRTVNKARGILPFNSVLLTILGLQLSNSRLPAALQWSHVLGITAAGLLILSCLLLLSIFWVHWGVESDYEDFRNEFNSTASLIRDRSAVLQFSTLLSIIGLVVGAARSALIMFGIDGPFPPIG